MDLDPTVGSEISKRRPCVVFSVDALNRQRNHVVVIPLSSQGTPRPPIVVATPSVGDASTARVDHVRAIDKRRLHERMAELSSEDMDEIEKGLRMVLGL